MSWNIKDLDKNKTEQSIINEQERLKLVRKSLKNIQTRIDNLRVTMNNTLSMLENKMLSLEESIECGEKFIKECNEHLTLDFQNGE